LRYGTLDASAFIIDMPKDDEDLDQWHQNQMVKAVCYPIFYVKPIINDLLIFLENQISKKKEILEIEGQKAAVKAKNKNVRKL